MYHFNIFLKNRLQGKEYREIKDISTSVFLVNRLCWLVIEKTSLFTSILCKTIIFQNYLIL